MPCYHPITAYQPVAGGPLSFIQKNDYNTRVIPCGKCRGCRLKRSREWGARCMHEKRLHKHSCSITLTYNDEHDPGYSLSHNDYQRFMKRLRKALSNERTKQNLLAGPTGIRINSQGKAAPISYYMCGEYGSQTSRPHFHAILFGIDFADKLYHKRTEAGQKIFISPTLDEIWGNGYGAIGDATFESAAYIARYIMKKYDWGKGRKDEILDPETGEIYIREKQYNQMSRNPAIGKGWLEKYQGDAYPQGKIVLKTHEVPTPRYYDKQYKNIDRAAYEQLQYIRYVEQLAHVADQTDERLAVQEQVAEAKTKSLSRGFQ